MTNPAKQTPLTTWHVENGARMVDFAGWSMPIQYTSIVEEHRATRQAVGIFDISHMARFRFDGAGAAAFLDRMLTRRVQDLAPGKIRYSLVTNEFGGILDDVLVYQLETPSGRLYHMLVVNAGNRAKISGWLRQHLDAQVAEGADIQFMDRTEETAMIAVQGPLASKICAPLVKADVGTLNYYGACVSEQFGRPCTVSRTGYTGEDGFELIVRSEDALDVWKNLLRAGRDEGVRAVGLGARDTLRLEAAMPLYGHELTEAIDPYQAGLKFAVNLKGRDFVGREALVRLKGRAGAPVRVGLEVEGRRVAREQSPVVIDERTVGEVTSGTFSPTLEKPIAMAYVEPDFAVVGTEVGVLIRGRGHAARVVPLPFYTRPK
jgi:aminomethyltransferase